MNLFATLTFAAVGITGAILGVTQPAQPQAAAAAAQTVVWAVGDMCPGRTTTTGCGPIANRIAADPETDALLVLGDAQYRNGTLTEYRTWFASQVDGTLGTTRVHPVPGNHDYTTTGAPGYYDYFGPRAGDRGHGWHTLTIGGWRIIAANSQCKHTGVGGCGATSPQGTFIINNLRAPETCEILYAHHPAFSDGYGDSTNGKALFTHAYNHNAELYLSGHDHSYQRFPFMRPNGTRTTSGTRPLVIGTGGIGLTSFNSTNRSEYRQNTKRGALRLVLTGTGYSGRFIATDGTTMDTFTGTCK